MQTCSGYFVISTSVDPPAPKLPDDVLLYLTDDELVELVTEGFNRGFTNAVNKMLGRVD